MQKADKIICAEHVLTMDSESRILKNAAIAISGTKIVGIASKTEILDNFEADDIFDTDKSVLMPGLINTHTHAAMSLFRGLAEDLSLNDWLNKHIWPAEAEFVDREFVRAGSELACLEFITAGVTMFADMYFYTEETIKIAENSGLRILAGEPLIAFPSPSAANSEIALRMTADLAERYASNERVHISICPHSVLNCEEKSLLATSRLSLELGLPIHIHLSETENENLEAKEKFGVSPTAYLQRCGLLGPRTILAHSVWLDESDRKLIRDSGAGIAHNPISNMKLASGIMSLLELAGVPVALGSDGAASNNTLDIFSEMRVAALLHRVSTADPKFPLSKKIVQMATIDGARVLGQGERLGSLEIGKQADIIALDLNNAHSSPIYDLYAHLVYSAMSSDVHMTMVAGNYLFKEGEYLSLDAEMILEQSRKYRDKIKKYANREE